ncbi:DNA translocase FtsK [Alkaliphilus serpentinus]|uniref:DNA translocase FtsK n=1 Tax=Alkaliphilus serpentinus TaxID=1482731 RepID=A0A833HLX7_9FIRM|nr:DNA translocase FtsK [Alkaliphilus serpentinus]KAB3526733.1 DNA translocase FtsK [Alkaliphilus serpentinus]
MNKRTRKQKTATFDLSKVNHEIKGLFLIAIGLVLLVAMHTNGAGAVGEAIKNLLKGLFANAAYILPYIIITCGILIFTNTLFWKDKSNILYFSIGFICILFYFSIGDNLVITKELKGLNFTDGVRFTYSQGVEGNGGGLIGYGFTSIIVKLFGDIAGIIIITSLLIISTLLYTKTSLLSFLRGVKDFIFKSFHIFKRSLSGLATIDEDPDFTLKEEPVIKGDISMEEMAVALDKRDIDEKIKILDFALNDKQEESKETVKKEKFTPEKEEEGIQLQVGDYYETNKIEYNLPNISLLNQVDQLSTKDDKRKLVKNAKLLEETLKNFGVEAKVLQVSKGPVITRYELQPSVGVKVSKIVNLNDDIALNMAAPAIRIEAPIPGKAAIGIEIPNEDISMVTLREVVDSNNFKATAGNLPFALGKDISGTPVVTDISKMPHLLIAGATGSGKSVCINTLILSLLYSSRPEDVRLILIDPKVVELNHYNGIPHLMIPVVTDPKKVTSALNWAVQEMTRRYKLFAENHVKDIKTYNDKAPELKLPFVVIIIDELADLMMVAANEVEDAICRLAQMARAAGIHLILATQRPSVDVITGIIKANIPSRIAFSVASQTDSRTILDMGGAEKLLGKGDMLFYPIGANKPIRLQGAFVSEKEVERVVTFIKNQIEKPHYETEIIDKLDQGESLDMSSTDDFFDRAVVMVVESQQASISMLQRRLRIGYNRAARLIDDMEERGIVGPHEGSKPRQVLISSIENLGIEE